MVALLIEAVHPSQEIAQQWIRVICLVNIRVGGATSLLADMILACIYEV